jgi:uncharacterized protein
MARINLIELPAKNYEATKAFYTSAFGWELSDFGSFACTMSEDCGIGIQGDLTEATRSLVAVIDVDDIEHAADVIAQQGGTITKPIHEIPGGKRFHFADPSGNELAVVQAN